MLFLTKEEFFKAFGEEYGPERWDNLTILDVITPEGIEGEEVGVQFGPSLAHDESKIIVKVAGSITFKDDFLDAYVFGVLPSK
jgi:hypothetical protein